MLQFEKNEQPQESWEAAPANNDLYSYSKGFVAIGARKTILHVSRRNLNPSNELKKKFGSKVVQNEQGYVTFLIFFVF